MVKPTATPPGEESKGFEFKEFEKLNALLESEEVFRILTKLSTLSEADLLRQMVGKGADTRELLNSPNCSKYPLEIAKIRLIQDLKKVTRSIQMTRNLRRQLETQGEK